MLARCRLNPAQRRLTPAHRHHCCAPSFTASSFSSLSSPAIAQLYSEPPASSLHRPSILKTRFTKEDSCLALRPCPLNSRFTISKEEPRKLTHYSPGPNRRRRRESRPNTNRRRNITLNNQTLPSPI